ncbi:hypothetical protein K493DRAFT_310053 [Basidiobolus meristosporus CBS 931.73]|uniref:Uncharacterized protein n=1 Tax=Basidiobolus meristosporus CBS 931.73 TaxID=1314790 RepID=A0A1Y1ZC32_9FUNG|nr:hypothetical protein K493DRAFT_310053 [Basidiobolus meristosporus CBS 931.73]|eukprot:ORY07842.1 hypothetical protein K493DRAFT_310053 [Basidiobolus meristosporus CBS 931.73]
MHHLFKEYLYQVIPTLLVSFTLNAIIVSNFLNDYTLIVVYTDLIIQLRLSNDLLVLNRMAASPNNGGTSNGPPSDIKATLEASGTPINSNHLREVSFDTERGFREGTFERFASPRTSAEQYEMNQRGVSTMERQSVSIPRRADQTFPSALSPPPFKRNTKIDEERVGLTEEQRTAYKNMHRFNSSSSG